MYVRIPRSYIVVAIVAAWWVDKILAQNTYSSVETLGMEQQDHHRLLLPTFQGVSQYSS